MTNVDALLQLNPSSNNDPLSSLDPDGNLLNGLIDIPCHLYDEDKFSMVKIDTEKTAKSNGRLKRNAWSENE